MIVVNARFLSQEITGVQRYGMEISRALKKQNTLIQFVCPKNIIHKSLAEELGAIQIGNMTGHLWEQIELPAYLKSKKNPLLINLANTAPILYRNKISTIHDVAFEKFPKNYSWRFRLAYKKIIPIIIKSSKKIFTVSEFSKKEICTLYNIPPQSVEVAPNAASSIFIRNKGGNLNKKNYILSTSSLTHQKNFIGLINAFSILQDQECELYLVGSLNGNFASKELLNKITSNSRIKFLGRVTDSELVALYSEARAFVFPSFYEGFGIPPLEAQACGCPVICSNTASLPEVCDDSALYFDPYNIKDIAKKIDLLLSDQTISNELIVKGYDNIKRFSWEDSAVKFSPLINTHNTKL